MPCNANEASSLQLSVGIPGTRDIRFTSCVRVPARGIAARALPKIQKGGRVLRIVFLLGRILSLFQFPARRPFQV